MDGRTDRLRHQHRWADRAPQRHPRLQNALRDDGAPAGPDQGLCRMTAAAGDLAIVSNMCSCFLGGWRPTEPGYPCIAKRWTRSDGREAMTRGACPNPATPRPLLPVALTPCPRCVSALPVSVTPLAVRAFRPFLVVSRAAGGNPAPFGRLTLREGVHPGPGDRPAGRQAHGCWSRSFAASAGSISTPPTASSSARVIPASIAIRDARLPSSSLSNSRIPGCISSRRASR